MLVVLSNLIDNAIEAQSSVPMDKKAVFIEIIPRPNAISILIKNPVSQSILEQNPALSTTKSDTLNHGLGIGSVKRIVSKRNGILEIGENNGMFYVHIYFPLL